MKDGATTVSALAIERRTIEVIPDDERHGTRGELHRLLLQQPARAIQLGGLHRLSGQVAQHGERTMAHARIGALRQQRGGEFRMDRCRPQTVRGDMEDAVIGVEAQVEHGRKIANLD